MKAAEAGAPLPRELFHDFLDARTPETHLPHEYHGAELVHAILDADTMRKKDACYRKAHAENMIARDPNMHRIKPTASLADYVACANTHYEFAQAQKTPFEILAEKEEQASSLAEASR